MPRKNEAGFLVSLSGPAKCQGEFRKKELHIKDTCYLCKVKENVTHYSDADMSRARYVS